MKESTVTGQYIFQQIKQKSEEMKELFHAMDELDRGSLLHTLLNNEYEKRKKEWQELQSTKYVIAT